MTPETLSKSGTEHSHQRALFAYVSMVFKHGWAAANDERCYQKGGMEYAESTYGSTHAVKVLDDLYAIANGGERNKIVAAKLKAEGVKPGIPDMHLPVPCGQYASLYIEMKKPGGRISAEQCERIARLKSYGNAVYVCYDWQSAVKVLHQYLSLPRRICGDSMNVHSNTMKENFNA